MDLSSLILLLAAVMFSAACAFLDANRDGLAHYRASIVWQAWAEPMGWAMNWWAWLRREIGVYMLRSPADRRWIPEQLPERLQSLLRTVNDGQHLSKALCFAGLFLVYPSLVGGFLERAICLVIFQLAFFQFYHRVLPNQPRES